MSADTDFGIWLRQLRNERDLTQEALADVVGCASQTIRSLESGRRRPSREMAARLADILAIHSPEREDFLRLARAPLTNTPPRTARTVADDPSSVAPLRQNISSLPLTADGLIGRHHDQEYLRDALLDNRQRLVTLLGPGGIGKTRLALQTITNVAAHFTETAFVAFASVSDLAGVIAASATAVGCPLSGVPDSQAALLTFLRDRKLLLVLDNLEHLLQPEQGDAIADLLTSILRAAPDVAILVTSRERLRLQAEWVVEIGGLNLPPDDQPESIAHSDAVLLFVERARRVTGDFTLGPHNQLTVAQICRRLDGLPLAIELAAAQVSFLPSPALLARLDQALPLLEGGPRDLPARQRTMRATIQWSYDLLSMDERRVFERLGVLVGSFSLQAAEAVGAGSGIASAQVLGLLRRLVDRSLVVRDNTGGDDVRYRLLEPVRQYASEQLDAQETKDRQARQRHAVYFAEWAAELGPQLRVPQDAATFMRVLTQIDQEYPNIRAVILGALASEQVEIAAHIGVALSVFWWYRGQQRESRVWLEAVLTKRERLPAQLHARTLLVYVVTLYGEAARSLPFSQEALTLFEQCSDVRGQAQALMFIGLAHLRLGNLTQATDALQRAHDLSQRLDDPWLATQVASNLGLAWAYAGQFARAAKWMEDVLATARTNNDTWNVSLALFNRALLAHAQGDVSHVAHFCRQWLESVPDPVIANGSAVAYALESVAVAAAVAGERMCAARLFGAADGLWEIAGMFIVTPHQDLYEQTIAMQRGVLADTQLAATWAEGRAMNVAEAVAYALGASQVQQTL